MHDDALPSARLWNPIRCACKKRVTIGHGECSGRCSDAIVVAREKEERARRARCSCLKGLFDLNHQPENRFVCKFKTLRNSPLELVALSKRQVCLSTADPGRILWLVTMCFRASSCSSKNSRETWNSRRFSEIQIFFVSFCKFRSGYSSKNALSSRVCHRQTFQKRSKIMFLKKGGERRRDYLRDWQIEIFRQPSLDNLSLRYYSRECSRRVGVNNLRREYVEESECCEKLKRNRE